MTVLRGLREAVSALYLIISSSSVSRCEGNFGVLNTSLTGAAFESIDRADECSWSLAFLRHKQPSEPYAVPYYLLIERENCRWNSHVKSFAILFSPHASGEYMKYLNSPWASCRIIRQRIRRRHHAVTHLDNAPPRRAQWNASPLLVGVVLRKQSASASLAFLS